MEITDIRIRKVMREDKIKAVVSVTFDEEFVVHDIKIIAGEQGCFLAMPSRKSMEGGYQDCAHPIKASMRERLQKEVLEAYEREVHRLGELEKVEAEEELEEAEGKEEPECVMEKASGE